VFKYEGKVIYCLDSKQRQRQHVAKSWKRYNEKKEIDDP
jgi:hypothetical protein